MPLKEIKMRRLFFDITRTSLIIINLIITALACMLIYISINAFNQDLELYSLNSNDSNQQPKIIHTYVAIIIAIIGIVIALLALIGLIGSAKKSKTILATYSAIIFILILLLFILVILTYTINNNYINSSSTSGNSIVQYKEVDKSFVNSTVVFYNYVDSSDMKTRIIDNIQKSFSCCGVNSPNDWTEYSLHKIPKSCCSEPVESSLPVFKYCSESDFKIGCWKALTDHFTANLNSVRIVLYVLISFGLICIVAALFMIKTLRKGLEA